MAHHSSQIDPKIAEIMKHFTRDDDLKLGATGRFPEGKLTSSDEGETRIGIGHTDEKVVMDFGNPTSWIGFTPDQADEIADTLRQHATAVRSRA